MKCPNCGIELEPGRIYCEKCGHEIQIVPDYDPLDELLIGQEDPAAGVQDGVFDALDREAGRQDKEKSREELSDPGKGGGKDKNARSRRLWKRGGLVLLGILVCFLVFAGSYYGITRKNNYSYQLRRGTELVKREKYAEALPYLERAQVLQADMEGTDTKPLEFLAYAYAYTGDKEQAVESMKRAVAIENAVRSDSEELASLYLKLMEILNLTGQTEQVEEIVEACPYEEIERKLTPYLIKKPSCSVPEGSYGYYLRLELSAEYGEVHYTLDGTMPTKDSPLYEEPIRIQEEGEILLSAVAVNQKGMVSEPLVQVYKLDFQESADDMEES